MSTSDLPIAFLNLAALHAPLRPPLDRLWAETLAESAFIGGKRVAAFEPAWAENCGTAHAIGVANGTDAIELVLQALDIGPGDEVIVVANTFVATAEAVVAAGATPVFVDVDPATLLVTAEHIESAITGATKAAIVVHLYGQLPVMGPIVDLCERRGMILLEDAAQAHGALHHGRRAGNFGRVAVEPEPDDDPAPFPILPLIHEVPGGIGDHVIQLLELGPPPPTGTATITP